MLFNSYEFIFFFMPITLFVFFLIGVRGHHRIAIALAGRDIPVFLRMVEPGLSRSYLWFHVVQLFDWCCA